MSSVAVDRAVTAPLLEKALREASGLGVLFSQAVADRVGMNPTDLESLDILILNGPLTAGRLAELTGLTTGAITGLVDRLERRGYARREPHPTDRRSVVVRPLTEQALRDLDPAYAGMQHATAELISHYSDEELAVIVDFLGRAITVTNEQIARLRAETAKRG